MIFSMRKKRIKEQNLLLPLESLAIIRISLAWSSTANQSRWWYVYVLVQSADQLEGPGTRDSIGLIIISSHFHLKGEMIWWSTQRKKNVLFYSPRGSLIKDELLRANKGKWRRCLVYKRRRGGGEGTLPLTSFSYSFPEFFQSGKAAPAPLECPSWPRVNASNLNLIWLSPGNNCCGTSFSEAPALCFWPWRKEEARRETSASPPSWLLMPIGPNSPTKARVVLRCPLNPE